MYTDNERKDKIGQILESARKEVGVSQTDLCADIGIARSTWRSWINGYTMPSVDMVFKIFRSLNSPILMALAKYSYPDNAILFDTDDPVVLKKQIKFIAQNSYTDFEMVAINDFLSGSEQSINVIIELSAAHVMSELSGRYKAATQIYEDYAIVDHFKKYARPYMPKPDIESLEQAIVYGKEAHFENAYAYSFENHTTGDLGKMIAELREANGKTQEELARMMLIDKATVRNWEENVTQICIDELLKMLELFNEPIGQFLTFYTYPYSKRSGAPDMVVKAEKELFEKIDKINDVLILIHLKFLSIGMYGSRYNLVQLISAYLQLPLEARQRNLNLVIMNYRESEQHNSINRFLHIPLPRISFLEKVREIGRTAYFHSETTYNI